jgi:hypothetical protein
MGDSRHVRRAGINKKRTGSNGNERAQTELRVKKKNNPTAVQFVPVAARLCPFPKVDFC